MAPLWLENDVPATLTLKNIPDAVYDRLKHAAEAPLLARRVQQVATGKGSGYGMGLKSFAAWAPH